MNTQRLSLLEQAIEAYRREGFVLVSQSTDAITLSYSAEKFNYGLFIILLLLFWPAAAFYFISYNNRRHRTVCVRITSQGYIEESGYTLDLITRERKRERWAWIVLLGILGFLALGAIMFLMTPQTRL